jgi:hypothetical protein
MKQKLSVLILSVLFLLASCAKNTPDTVVETLPTGTTLAMGTFISNAHPTSGTVKVIQDAAGKKHLLFENFRSDNGPRLKVWISPNNTASPYQEIGALKAVTGNFSYELDLSANHMINNRVLIWCEPFSVLFGHAVLQ